MPLLSRWTLSPSISIKALNTHSPPASRTPHCHPPQYIMIRNLPKSVFLPIKYFRSDSLPDGVYVCACGWWAFQHKELGLRYFNNNKRERQPVEGIRDQWRRQNESEFRPTEKKRYEWTTCWAEKHTASTNTEDQQRRAMVVVLCMAFRVVASWTFPLCIYGLLADDRNFGMGSRQYNTKPFAGEHCLTTDTPLNAANG